MIIVRRRYLSVFVLLLVIAFVFTSRTATAQVDAHFSQYYACPLWLNPGLTGVMDGTFRINANYKRQWASIADPYSTTALSFDARPFMHLSLGGTILNQSAGNAGYSHLNAMASAAYHLSIDNAQMNVLSIGIQAGFVSHHFDPGKLQSGSQWNPSSGFDPGTPSGEVFNNTSSLAFDANVGIFYYNKNPDTRVNPFMGVSLYHLPRPDNSFLGNSGERLPMRLDIHGGLKIMLNNQINLTPQLLYLRQGDAYEMACSMYAQYMLGDISDFIFGATYRYKDAIVPFAGIHIGDFTMGLSYDVNVSGLRSASLKQGGLELSLSYSKHKDLREIHLTCPRF